jgi:D-glycero-alpha-D-manno-heptose-7-phosphate kinase
MAKEAVRARAPVRIDFAGGWTDVAEFCMDEPGFVVNAAITIYSYVTVLPGIADLGVSLCSRGELPEEGVRIYSSDFDRYVEVKSIRELEYDGNIDLVKAALKDAAVTGGLSIITQSQAPPGSGLGTSAAMGVCLLAALFRYTGKHILKYQIAEEASRIEREELGIRGGKQDQYSSALGSIQFLEFRGEAVRSSALNLPASIFLELERSLVLCYTGKSRLSGDVHASVLQRFIDGNPDTVAAIRGLKKTAYEMKDVLLQGDIVRFGGLLSENWALQKALHPSITTEEIERLFAVAQAEGATGGKACGAGGGGCLLFACRPETEHRVRRALEEDGARILEFGFDRLGVETWTTPIGY